MAKTTISVLRGWFSPGKYPTAVQFWDWLDSFVHKDDKIAISSVTELPERLNNKCETSWGQEVQELLGAKAEGWIDVSQIGGSFMAGDDGYKKCRVILLEGTREAGSDVMEITPHMVEVNMSALNRLHSDGVNRFEAFVGQVVVYFYMTTSDAGMYTCRVDVVDPESKLVDYTVEVQNDPVGVENLIGE